MAAGWIFTAPLMTTVPVRALTMTLEGASAGATSIFSIMPLILMRSVAPGAASMEPETAQVALASRWPRVRLMPYAPHTAVGGWASVRLKGSVGVIGQAGCRERG